jgi:hypothetical protein
MDVPTLLLIPLSAAIILFAVIALARLARSWRLRETDEKVVLDPEHLVLLDEKQRILGTLRDLEHEHALGKLSDSDYQGLKRHFEHEAMSIIARLERFESRTSESPPAARSEAS